MIVIGAAPVPMDFDDAQWLFGRGGYWLELLRAEDGADRLGPWSTSAEAERFIAVLLGDRP